MLSTHVVFQTTRLTIPLLANVAFVRFLLRVNTLVLCQTTRCTKSFIAHITFIRFLVRVNTHVSGQIEWFIKNLLANIALVLRSLSLPSSLRRSLFFSYLILLRNDFIKNDIIIITFIRYSQTQHSLFFSLQSFFSLLSVARDHHRFHVFRSFRMCILSSVFARH